MRRERVAKKEFVMKRKTVVSFILLCSIICCLLYNQKSTYAKEVNDEEEIEQLIRETKTKAKIPSISVVTVENGKVQYYGDDSKKLYEIGSMTKAFTALGILYLSKQGQLDLDAEVQMYLHDFAPTYKGKKVSVTVNDLLYQTSGYTNSEKDYPSATANMSLKDWYDTIYNAPLTFAPGTQYAYSNTNYNLLGMLIERVSGQSYAAFMQEKILKPLNLEHTFCGNENLTQDMISGKRLGYGFTFNYEQPIAPGTIPAGYFLSNIEDMGQWIAIQLGTADIPNEYEELILQSHELDTNRNAGGNDYYAGWITYDDGIMGHSGGTCNYSSRLLYDRKDDIGVCVLTNLNAVASTDRLCEQILARKQGKEIPKFCYDVWRIFDIIFTVVTIVALVMMVVFRYALKRKSKRMISILCAILLSVLTITFAIVIPFIFQASWVTIIRIWAPYSMGIGMLFLIICCAIGMHSCIKRSDKR
ncbi:MAG: hypothetical protein E7256_00035 [Lachnospiraceae bacterium]|nr:hypothetical protein [Lachnospiraceae bacterium]